MAPTKNKPPQARLHGKSGILKKLKSWLSVEYAKKLAFDPNYLTPTCYVILLFEAVLNVLIIEKVKYTEIDWNAYMQEVEGFLNGTLDYHKLKGDTGPLVYPAGFVYIYSILYYVTSHGKNIYLAQYIFLILYLLQTYLVHRIFRKSMKLPPYALILVTLTSYRIHSIFVLRLFNDTIAVLLFYVSLNLFISDKWVIGSIFYSLAVAVKMNILLYAPCLLIAYLTNLSLLQTALNLSICAFIQLLLGLPFLYVNPIAYIQGSFDLGRVFEHKWTVNYRFLPRSIFEYQGFHVFLLALQIVLLIVFTPQFKCYLSSYAKLNIVTKQFLKSIKEERKKRIKETKKLSKTQKQFLDSFEHSLRNSQSEGETDPLDDAEKLEDKLSKITQLFILPFFVTNLIGVTCARSLHYQFYSWYFHSLVYLVFCTRFNRSFSFLLLGLIEYCWNVYPSTNFSSALLHICHITLLYGVYKSMKE
nr:unnamed protein product [Callosobruchus analis]